MASTKSRTKSTARKASKEVTMDKAVGTTMADIWAAEQRVAQREQEGNMTISTKMMARAEVMAAKAPAASGFCECGCGAKPKGRKSRFIPGHDSRMRSNATGGPRRITECECGCGQFPRSARSRFLPGHDAKLLSQLVRELKAQATGNATADEALSEALEMAAKIKQESDDEEAADKAAESEEDIS
jgi:hypothetical protein